jgi:hypothetical protein
MLIFSLLLLLMDLKSSWIKEYVYNCTVGSIIYRNVTYLIKTAQRWAAAKLYWSKAIT